MQPSSAGLKVFFSTAVSNFHVFLAGKDENFPQVRPMPKLKTRFKTFLQNGFKYNKTLLERIFGPRHTRSVGSFFMCIRDV